MTETSLRKIIQKLLLVCYLFKVNIYAAKISKHNSNHEKNNYSFSDFKRRSIELSGSKKKKTTKNRNNVKT